MSLFSRSVESFTWSSLSNFLRLPFGFLQSIILARLLPVEYFGIYGGVYAIIALSSMAFEFGLGTAFIHRTSSTLNEDRAAKNFLTLSLGFHLIWLVLLLGFGVLYFDGTRLLVLLILGATTFFSRLTEPVRLILVRRVQFRRLAIIEFGNVVIVAFVSIFIAYYTRSIWALLASSIVSVFWYGIMLYGWKPVWKPGFAWDIPKIKYYLSFGIKAMPANILGAALEHIDNMWVNYYLGDLSLGYYSRAYKFATYPRTILSTPINDVSLSTFAELKYDREGISRAFFRSISLIIRCSFLLGGWLVLIAPNFIHLFLGDQWYPMLDAFRMMLLFAIFDPIKLLLSNILIAMGEPGRVSVSRFYQLAVFVFCLFIFGLRWGIVGVAIAVNIMLLTGIAVLYFYSKEYLDYSMKKMLLSPFIALGAGLFLGVVALSMRISQSASFGEGLLLTIVFVSSYLIILFILEGKYVFQMLIEYQGLMRKSSIMSVYNSDKMD